jgi:hypothetical protein
MRTLACALAALMLAGVAACGRGGSGTSAGATPAPNVATARRVRVTLQLEHATVAVTDEVLPFTLRLTNPEDAAVRVDFTGEPLFPRGPREHVKAPALWYTIERDDRASSAGSVWHRYATRDTVLAAGETLEVPVQHSLRAVGLSPGSYRMRAGIGTHASGWESFAVTP